MSPMTSSLLARAARLPGSGRAVLRQGRAAAVAAALCCLPLAPAAADPAPAPPPAAGAPETAAPAPTARGGAAPRERAHDIEFLLGALKAAPDEESAKLVERRILALWLASGSDTADLLVARARAATDARDLDLALQLLDAVVELNPGFAEAWNQRATVHFLKKDYAQSLADIRQVLAREPRHFGALAGLGMILQEFGDDKRALEMFRRALAIHPHLPRIPDLVKGLSEKVDGRDI